jgi:hypothetical protein
MTLPDLDARRSTMLLFPLVLPLLFQALVRVPAAAWVRVMLFVKCSCLSEAAWACMCRRVDVATVVHLQPLVGPATTTQPTASQYAP